MSRYRVILSENFVTVEQVEQPPITIERIGYNRYKVVLTASGRIFVLGDVTETGTGSVDINAAFQLAAELNEMGVGSAEITALFNVSGEVTEGGTGSIRVFSGQELEGLISEAGFGSVNIAAAFELAGNVLEAGVGAVEITALFNVAGIASEAGTGSVKVLAGFELAGEANEAGVGSVVVEEDTPPVQLLLDEYPNAAAAYSLRQLRTGVTNVVRVRRSSDDAEQDFTAAQIAAEEDVTWVGAGNDGFVVTLYDQSTNGRNKTEATLAFQPWIVIDGAAVKRDGIRTYYGNGSTRGRLRAIFTNTNTGDTPYSAFTVGDNLSQLASNQSFGIMAASGSIDRRYLGHLGNDTSTTKSIRLIGGNTVFSANETGMQIHAITYGSGGGAFGLRINDEAKAVNSFNNTGLNLQADSAFCFGNFRSNTPSDNYSNGPLAEAYGATDIYYFSDQSANAEAITTILNDLHGVY